MVSKDKVILEPPCPPDWSVKFSTIWRVNKPGSVKQSASLLSDSLRPHLGPSSMQVPSGHVQGGPLWHCMEWNMPFINSQENG